MALDYLKQVLKGLSTMAPGGGVGGGPGVREKRQSAKELLQERIFQDRTKEKDFQQNQGRLNAANQAQVQEHQSNIDLNKSKEKDLNDSRSFSQATTMGDKYAGGTWQAAPTPPPGDLSVTRPRDMSQIPEAEREFVDPNETTVQHNVSNGPDPMGRPFVNAGGQMMIPKSPEEIERQKLASANAVDDSHQADISKHLKAYSDAFPDFAAAHKDDIARASFHSMTGAPLPEQSIEQMATDLYKRAGSASPTDPAQKASADLADHLMAEKKAKPGGADAAGDITSRNPLLPHGALDESVFDKEPNSIKTLAKGLANYSLPTPSGFALKEGSPWNRALQLASQYDDTFDSSQYKVRQNLKNDFTSGKTAQTIKSLNTVVAHLDSLDKSTQSLNNSDFHLANQGKNIAKTHLGGYPELTTMHNDANAVADELSTAFRQSNISDTEVKNWRSNLKDESTPAEFKAWIKSGVDLIRGREGAVEDQWTRGMGKPLETPIWSPTAKKVLDRFDGKDTDSNTGTSKIHLRLTTKSGATADRPNLDAVKDKDLIDKMKAAGAVEVK